MRKITYIFLMIIMYSCSSKVEPNQYLAPLNIQLQENYKELYNNYSPAIGDLLVEFKLKISASDYDNIVKIIKESPEFRHLDSIEPYPYGTDKFSRNKTQEYTAERNGIYFKHLFISTGNSGWESYTLYLKKDSILDFQYQDE